MNSEYHHRLQQARRRVARSRRTVERDALRLANVAQATLNRRLQSSGRPLPMLLGAIGIGMIAARLFSTFGAGESWQAKMYEFATRRIGGQFWKQMLETVMGSFGDDDASDAEADSEDATESEDAS